MALQETVVNVKQTNSWEKRNRKDNKIYQTIYQTNQINLIIFLRISGPGKTGIKQINVMKLSRLNEFCFNLIKTCYTILSLCCHNLISLCLTNLLNTVDVHE